MSDIFCVLPTLPYCLPYTHHSVKWEFWMSLLIQLNVDVTLQCHLQQSNSVFTTSTLSCPGDFFPRFRFFTNCKCQKRKWVLEMEKISSFSTGFSLNTPDLSTATFCMFAELSIIVCQIKTASLVVWLWFVWTSRDSTIQNCSLYILMFPQMKNPVKLKILSRFHASLN